MSPLYLAVKLVLSAAIIVAVSEISKRLPTVGALVASLPLTSLLAVLWMKFDKVPDEKIATHLWGTFWYVLPSLPMFLLVPWMMRKGMAFSVSLSAGIVLTIALYLGMTVLMKRTGWM
jgi:hypothetical protein